MNEAEIKVLLVEDEPLLQFVFKRQMQKLGFSVHIVGNGAAAVERVASEDFHLIFMDVNMPVMDGLDATTHIRKKEQYKTSRVPIIGLTAYGERQLCINAGMDDFIQKPVMLQELSEVIEKWKERPAQHNEDVTDEKTFLSRIEKLRLDRGIGRSEEENS